MGAQLYGGIREGFSEEMGIEVDPEGCTGIYKEKKGARAFSEVRTICAKACVPERTPCVATSKELQS